MEATRRSFNRDFLLALAADFKKHGASAIEKVRKQQPAAYMKICALLVPREMRVEHSGGVKSLSDEELERGIEMITAMLAAREAGAGAKVIEASPEPEPLENSEHRRLPRSVPRSENGARIWARRRKTRPHAPEPPTPRSELRFSRENRCDRQPDIGMRAELSGAGIAVIGATAHAVVRWADRLGRSYQDICETIREFMRREVAIRASGVAGLAWDFFACRQATTLSVDAREVS